MAIYGGGAVSDDSGRSDICTPGAARASLYGGAGDSSDRMLGRCDRSEAVGWLRTEGLRTEPEADERPPIRSSASKLNTRRCRAHLLPRGSSLDAAEDESLLRLRRANIKNAIMRPRPINVMGTATAACNPGEHEIPLHCFASEKMADDPLVAAAAGVTGEVKVVLSVEPVGEDADPDEVFVDSAPTALIR